MGKVRAAVAACLLTFASQAHAATVFDNGAPTLGGGLNFTKGTVEYGAADDFRLTTAAMITGATFYALTTTAVTNLTYYIYAAGGTGPGAQLASGTAQNLTYQLTGRAAAGAFTGYSEGLVTFSFASGFAAAANTTYWLGIQDTAANNSYHFWESTSANTTSFANVSYMGQPYTATSMQLSFSLTGNATAVPEPTSWSLMIVGFGVIGGFARYRRTVRRIARA